jgi:hypothetical protein
MSFDSKENNAEKMLKGILELNALIIIGLSVLEQNVRLSMTGVFEAALGPGWLSRVLEEQHITLFKVESVLIIKRHSSQFVLTEKGFVEGASLGFWVELLNRETYKQLKGVPIHAFKYRPPTARRSGIYHSFKELKDFRNQLVHNRISVGSSKGETALFLRKLQKAGKDLRTLISYVNPEALKLLPGDVDKKIARLEKLL